MEFSLAAEDIILKRVKALIGKDPNADLSSTDLKRLAHKVKVLSDYFTKCQSDRPDLYLMDNGLLAAYIAYFLPSNMLKIHKPLHELFSHPSASMAHCRELDILDLGAGPGTATMGFISYLTEELKLFDGELKLRITLADHAARSLEEAGRLIREIFQSNFGSFTDKNPVTLELETVVTDISLFSSRANRKYDFIILSNSIGEIAKNGDGLKRGEGLIERLTQGCLKDNGSIIILEPALRPNSRMLLLLRKELLAAGDLNVYSPCITAGPCGALERPRDWCHEAHEWIPPVIVNEIDKLTGFDKSRLKYSTSKLSPVNKSPLRPQNRAKVKSSIVPQSIEQ